MNQSYAYLFKYILVGDSGVGKSCILLQFTDNKFSQGHDSTIGIEFGSKIINVFDKNVKLQIWDTAGQESFKSIIRSYYRGSICAILVYDITQRSTFDNLKSWLDETRQYGNCEHMTIMLAGNKFDLQQNREVSEDEGKQFSLQNNLIFLETSAKNSHNIDEIFRISCEQVFKKIQELKLEEFFVYKYNIQLQNNNKQDCKIEKTGNDQKQEIITSQNYNDKKQNECC